MFFKKIFFDLCLIVTYMFWEEYIALQGWYREQIIYKRNVAMVSLARATDTLVKQTNLLGIICAQALQWLPSVWTAPQVVKQKKNHL